MDNVVATVKPMRFRDVERLRLEAVKAQWAGKFQDPSPAASPVQSIVTKETK